MGKNDRAMLCRNAPKLGVSKDKSFHDQRFIIEKKKGVRGALGLGSDFDVRFYFR